MYVDVHNLTYYSIEGHANIYKCMMDDIPFDLFWTLYICIGTRELQVYMLCDCWCQVSVTTW